MKDNFFLSLNLIINDPSVLHKLYCHYLSTINAIYKKFLVFQIKANDFRSSFDLFEDFSHQRTFQTSQNNFLICIFVV